MVLTTADFTGFLGFPGFQDFKQKKVLRKPDAKKPPRILRFERIPGTPLRFQKGLGREDLAMHPHEELSPICMPTLYVEKGKSVTYKKKKTKTGEVTKSVGDDAVERSKYLGLLGEMAIVVLDQETESWDAVKAIICSGVKVRLEGVATLDDALTFLDSGVTKIVLPASTWDAKEACDITGKYKNRFVALFSSEGAEVDTKLMKKISAHVSEVLVEFESLAETVDSKSKTFADLEAVAAASKQLQLAVGVTGSIGSVEEIVAIEKLGLRPQIGDALATGKLEVADLIVPFIRTDRQDKLFTTVVVDQQHVALGLVYSNEESVRAAMRKRAGIYHSRRRGLWHKGLSSGATQDLHEVCLDCDRDALRFVVSQNGVGFCHLNRYTCWDGDRGVGHLFRTLLERKTNPVENSYTNKLLNKPEMLNAKMLEEASEIIEAKERDHVAAEAADVLYFASVICTRAGVSFKDVENHLDRRSRRVRRRKGAAKPYAVEMLRKANSKKKQEEESTTTTT
eukprot:jgi/Bigna1/85008/estExt_fgenesh1_pg.C_10591